MLHQASTYKHYLLNVECVHGYEHGLRGIGDSSVDGCFSHVVFQHIPDPEVTLAYVREMGRVLRPGGWALFQVSTDPSIHRRPGGLRRRVRALVGRDPDDRAWWGSAVDPQALRGAVRDGGMVLESVLDEGSQYTTVHARRAPG